MRATTKAEYAAKMERRNATPRRRYVQPLNRQKRRLVTGCGVEGPPWHEVANEFARRRFSGSSRLTLNPLAALKRGFSRKNPKHREST